MEFNVEDELIRGDSLIINIELEEEITMNDIDTLTLTARPYVDGDILFDKSKEDFKIEDNIISVEILPEDTQELIYKKFEFDVEIVLKDRTTRSVLGLINLIKDYTTHKKGSDDIES